MTKKVVILIVVVSLLLGSLFMFFIDYTKGQKRSLKIFGRRILNSIEMLSSNQSKWEKNKLVVIPAIWKEIKWANRSTWPLWLRGGLNLFNNTSSLYTIHLYQRIDPNSKPPYDWPYCKNVHEEAGVYLKFIYDYYYDLPDKMLFLQGSPYGHSPHPIESALCIRDDVHYASVNTLWIKQRRWTYWPRDKNDDIGLMYKCAKRVLTLFGFDGESQLNPFNITPKEHNAIGTMCCAQFYVTKERIHHYTYEQWSSLYNASLQPYCTAERDRETPGRRGVKWFGGSFEHLWHVILGLHSTHMPPPRTKTNTDRCHLFRSACKGSPCSHS